MYSQGYELKTKTDFDTAMLLKKNVQVMEEGSILNKGGRIEKITRTAIRINDLYYFKGNCEFKIN